MSAVTSGIHHVTAISGEPQRNVDLYVGLLGLRLVKKTVNFDDPGTYHLYYADGLAHPGSFLTFFPWADAPPGRIGQGQAVATAYVVPEGALDYWMDRLAAEAVDFDAPTERFGLRVLPFRDPHGLALEIVEVAGATGGWAEGPIPLDAALGAFHAVTLCVDDPEPLARLLTEVMGFTATAEDGDRLRLTNPSADRAAHVDLHCTPGMERSRLGVGTVHHVAFRVKDDERQREARELLIERGFEPTPVVDRQYFRSVYFRTPGGVLFELATDPPGFAVDEPADRLGSGLMLPPQYEHLRARLEVALPPLRLPYPPSTA